MATTEAADFFIKCRDLMINLYDRWLDEHEYEDINDYAVPIKLIAEKCGVTIERMIKKPFGCEFSVGDKRFLLSVNSSTYTYKAVIGKEEKGGSW